ncbi:MAG: hypothetical protein WCH35_02725 [Comamonadaceae bacterium]
MNPIDDETVNSERVSCKTFSPLGKPACHSAELPISQLVAQVYETAPVALRVSLLEQLLKPLGILSLMAIANGVFARIRFTSGWPDMHIRWEDAQTVQAKDVVALVERVQLVSVSSVNGLAKMIAASPMMAGSAAAALLVTLLMQRARSRRADDAVVGDSFTLPG